MKADIWMPLYVNDYLGDTMDLEAEGHGIYLLLMFNLWKKAVLPSDMNKLKRMTRTDNEELLLEILDDYFELTDKGYVQNRVIEELNKANERKEKASENGKKGGRPKKEKKPNPFSEKTEPFFSENPTLSVEKPNPKAKRNLNKSSSPSPSYIKIKDKEKINKKEKTEKTALPETEVSSEPEPEILDQEKETEIVEVKNTEAEIYTAVKTVFLKEQLGHKFTNYGKEGKAIKQLIIKAKARAPDSLDVFLFGMIEAFADLRAREKFYKSQPFLPSALNATGIWDRVLNEVQTRWQQNQAVMDDDDDEVIF